MDGKTVQSLHNGEMMPKTGGGDINGNARSREFSLRPPGACQFDAGPNLRYGWAVPDEKRKVFFVLFVALSRLGLKIEQGEMGDRRHLSSRCDEEREMK